MPDAGPHRLYYSVDSEWTEVVASLTAPRLGADRRATARRVRSPACIPKTLASAAGHDACGVTAREAATAALVIITNDESSGGLENRRAGRQARAA